MPRPNLKAQQRFKEAVTKLLESYGARTGRFYDLKLDTPAGLLHISVNETWVATRFDDVALGRAFTDSCGRPCNPYSGKWNFHYSESLNPEIVVADLQFWFDKLMTWKRQDEPSRSH